MVETLITTHRHDDDAILVEVSGDLANAAVVAQLRRTLVEMINQRPVRRVLLDLNHVTDIDGAAIGTVVAGCDALGDVGVAVLVCGLPTTLSELRAGGLTAPRAPETHPFPH